METYDVVILGGGSAGESTAALVAAAGKRVALVEERLVGGECPYFACMPSKAMLAAAELRLHIRQAAKTGAVSRPVALDDDRDAYRAAAAWRDLVARDRDDSLATQHLRDLGVSVTRARGRIEGYAVVRAGELPIGWQHLVLATGARALEAQVDGLDTVPED